MEPPEIRAFSTEGQYYAPAEPEAPRERLQYPLAFCRECGQEYYLVSRHHDDEGERMLPRSPLLNVPEDEVSGDPGFFSIERDGLWHEEEDLPDNWFEFRKSGPKLKPRYAEHEPLRLWLQPDGRATGSAEPGAVEGWWQPKPLMLCLRCHAAYDLRETGDFRKLVTLSQTGRSTATTILGSAAVVAVREDPSVEPEARKLLSFTDNRQDAALQAGHLNDFVQVVLLRGALVRALEAEHELTFDRIGAAIFQAMDLDPGVYMQEAVAAGPGFDEARRAVVDLLDYRAIEDLARAWRVAQPNLEQCGLLRIDYHGIPELAFDDTLWKTAPIMAAAAPERRHEILRAILDHLRGVLAVDAEALNEEQARRLVKRVNASLREPWAFDDFERLRRGTVALLPGVVPANRDQTISLRLGARSAIGRYLRSRRTWDLEENLTVDVVEGLVETIITALRGHILSVVERQGEPYGVQIRVSALKWHKGEGRVPGPDPVRAKSLHLRRQDLISGEPNAYFLRLYKDHAHAMAGLLSVEHTGQVRIDDRITRENAFRAGKLSVLFCSPTMELGVDIKDLSIVHLRNVPPTPANYAQRSGRAGRGGKPALVLAFSSYGNAHDHYFFRHKTRMIAGAVAPPRIDLANKELIEAHLHSVWLSIIGLGLKSSIADVLDLDQPEFLLLAETAAAIEASASRHQEIVAVLREVTSTVEPDLSGAPCFCDAWLDGTARNAAHAFDSVFDRWRELYRAAVEQRDAARRRIDSPRLGRRERDAAEQQEREAKREIERNCSPPA